MHVEYKTAGGDRVPLSIIRIRIRGEGGGECEGGVGTVEKGLWGMVSVFVLVERWVGRYFMKHSS